MVKSEIEKIWLRLVDLAWKIKYIPKRQNPTLNKKPLIVSLTGGWPVLGYHLRYQKGANEGCWEPGSEESHSQCLLQLRDIFHPLSGILYNKYKLPARTPDSFLITHTHTCAACQKSYFGTLQWVTTVIKAQGNWEESTWLQKGQRSGSPASRSPRAWHHVCTSKKLDSLRLSLSKFKVAPAGLELHNKSSHIVKLKIKYTFFEILIIISDDVLFQVKLILFYKKGSESARI